MTLNHLNLTSQDFVLRDARKKEIFDMKEQMERTPTEFPKFVEGQICKDADEEAAVLAGGKSSAPATMTRPKAPKRKNGRRV